LAATNIWRERTVVIGVVSISRKGPPRSFSNPRKRLLVVVVDTVPFSRVLLWQIGDFSGVVDPGLEWELAFAIVIDGRVTTMSIAAAYREDKGDDEQRGQTCITGPLGLIYR
jgi:hypothetical protein